MLSLRGHQKWLVPILLGNIDSLSILLCTHAIKCSMYSGAGILVGLLKFSESCHRYSNLSSVSGVFLHNLKH